MSDYDRDSWEQRWSRALREHGDRVAQRPPSVEAVLAALDPDRWELVAEDRPRPQAGTGVDAVIRARRRGP